MIKRIHVNRHNIAFNKKNNNNKKPVITIKTYKSNNYANEVLIDGPSKIVYRPEKPLSCGAVLWVETNSEIKIIR